MAIFTCPRGGHYQNDKFRPLKDGDTILDQSHSYYGVVSNCRDKECDISWFRISSPDKLYSKGVYAYDSMIRDLIFLKVNKPTVFLGKL